MCMKSSLKYKIVLYYPFFTFSCKFERNLVVSCTPNVLTQTLGNKSNAVLQKLVLFFQHHQEKTDRQTAGGLALVIALVVQLAE